MIAKQIYDKIANKIFSTKFKSKWGDEVLDMNTDTTGGIVFLTILNKRNGDVLGCWGDNSGNIRESVMGALTKINSMDDRFEPVRSNTIPIDDTSFEITNIYLGNKDRVDYEEWNRRLNGNERGRVSMIAEGKHSQKRAFFIPSMAMEYDNTELMNMLIKKAGLKKGEENLYLAESDDYVDEFYKEAEKKKIGGGIVLLFNSIISYIKVIIAIVIITIFILLIVDYIRATYKAHTPRIKIAF